MNDLNRAEYGSSDRDATGALNALITQSRQIREDPEVLLESLSPQLTLADRRVVEDADMRRLLLDTYREALKHNEHGWLDDVLAFRRSWGFDPADIKVPTLLWHGAEDRFSPINHTAGRTHSSGRKLDSARGWTLQRHGGAPVRALLGKRPHADTIRGGPSVRPPCDRRPVGVKSSGRHSASPPPPGHRCESWRPMQASGCSTPRRRRERPAHWPRAGHSSVPAGLRVREEPRRQARAMMAAQRAIVRYGEDPDQARRIYVSLRTQ